MSIAKPLTKEFLLTRGYCCNNGCKNCPYKPKGMKNQFFYTSKAEDGTESIASLNVNKVIRAGSIDGNFMVILDDFHERVEQEPDIDPKTNKMKGFKRVRNTYQSTITLSAEDAERFKKLTNIE